MYTVRGLGCCSSEVQKRRRSHEASNVDENGKRPKNFANFIFLRPRFGEEEEKGTINIRLRNSCFNIPHFVSIKSALFFLLAFVYNESFLFGKIDAMLFSGQSIASLACQFILFIICDGCNAYFFISFISGTILRVSFQMRFRSIIFV